MPSQLHSNRSHNQGTIRCICATPSTLEWRMITRAQSSAYVPACHTRRKNRQLAVKPTHCNEQKRNKIVRNYVR